VLVPQLEHREEELVRPNAVPAEVLEAEEPQQVEVRAAPFEALLALIHRGLLVRLRPRVRPLAPSHPHAPSASREAG